MKTQYYVQAIARTMLRNVTEDPAAMKVHPRFLMGLDYQDFTDGYKALLALFRRLYEDIAKDPAAYAMPLFEAVEDNPKDVSYTRSYAGFCRVPNLLLALGAVSDLADFTLTVTGEVLLEAVKTLKITNMAQLLTKFREHGFELAGYEKNVKVGDTLTISYTDQRALIVVLKAMADAQAELKKGNLRMPKDYFYILMPDLLADEKVKEPKPAVERLLQSLEPESRKIAARLHEIAAPRSAWVCKTHGLMRGNWRCVYTEKTDKMVLMSLIAEQGWLTVKLNLQHIGGYVGVADIYPEGFKDKLKTNGWPCSRCHESCMGGFAFKMDGKDYNKCRASAFTFAGDRDMAGELRYYEELLERELAVR